MRFRYLKLSITVTALCGLSAMFAFITVKVFKPVPRVSIFLQDMTSSYTFLDDVYLLNMPALRGRLENWANHIYSVTQQPICLASKFSNFQEDPEVSISVCSVGAKLSDLARRADDSGVVGVQLGEKKLGEIEWLTEVKFDAELFLILLFSYGVVAFLVCLLIYLLFYRAIDSKSHHDEPGAGDIHRSLYRIMGSNRRTMAFHDNWVYGERSHPYINFINLDGSKLRLRASLSDVAAIFPSARFINRSAFINTAVGVHQIKDEKVVLKIKTGDLVFDVDPSYQEATAF